MSGGVNPTVQTLLAQRRAELSSAKDRLRSGVEKIAQASAQVADLQVVLKQEQVIVAEKNAATDALMVSIGKETATVNDAVAAGADDEEVAAKIAAEVEAIKTDADRELAAAEPIIQAAIAALATLEKSALTELKSFGSPAADVVMVSLE